VGVTDGVVDSDGGMIIGVNSGKRVGACFTISSETRGADSGAISEGGVALCGVISSVGVGDGGFACSGFAMISESISILVGGDASIWGSTDVSSSSDGGSSECDFSDIVGVAALVSTWIGCRS